jgi:hypothetical protein
MTKKKKPDAPSPLPAAQVRIVDDDAYLERAKLIVAADKIIKKDAKVEAKAKLQTALAVAEDQGAPLTRDDDDGPPFPDLLIRNSRVVPKPTYRNALIALDALGAGCSYDSFADRRYVAGQELGSQVGQVTDDVCLLIRCLCRDRYGFDPGKENTWDAVNYKCRENTYHPILDYLDSIEFDYDGKSRIDTWMTDYLGVEDTPFVRAFSRLILIASVRRVREPGVKWDYMPVLVGPENKAKSLAIETLYGKKYFSDQKLIGISDKEIAEAVRGRWANESADLAGLRKADTDQMKAQTTRTSDRVRPAYGRAVIDVPRQNVMWGTTNDPIFLRSQHGNRRMPPFITGKIDIAGIERDRDQLWTEADKAEREHGPTLAIPAEVWEEAQARQDEHTEQDPWKDDPLGDVAQWAARAAVAIKRSNAVTAKANDGAKLDPIPYERNEFRGDERISSGWLLAVALDIKVKDQTPLLTHRLSTCMQQLGWSSPRVLKIEGMAQRGYKRTIKNEE